MPSRLGRCQVKDHIGLERKIVPLRILRTCLRLVKVFLSVSMDSAISLTLGLSLISSTQ